MVRFVGAIVALAACGSAAPTPPPVAAPAPVVVVADAPSPDAGLPALTAEDGKQIFEQYCHPCHSLDGSPMPGPTFKGYVGVHLELADGTAVTGSLERFAAALHQPQPLRGFPAAMPTFEGMFDQRHIDALILFAKTLQ